MSLGRGHNKNYAPHKFAPSVSKGRGIGKPMVYSKKDEDLALYLEHTQNEYGVTNPHEAYIASSPGELNCDSLVFMTGSVNQELYQDDRFCDSDVLDTIKNAMKNFHSLERVTFEHIRIRLNDFMDDGKRVRFNSAYLYANIDGTTGYPMTDLRDGQERSILESEDVLYAVNTQDRNEGFVEHMLTKKHGEAKVYGYTFKTTSNNSPLPASDRYHKESFEEWLGLDPAIEDIYNLKNLDAFVEFIKFNTEGKGVHVVVSGGSELMSASDEGKKEGRYKSMILAQVYIAMKILRKVGLVFLMYTVFDSVKICRPETCYLGTADRFLVCKNFRANNSCTKVTKFFADCVTFNDTNLNNQVEIVELVPVQSILADRAFFQYMCKSNESIGEKQALEVNKICRFVGTWHNRRPQIDFDDFLGKRIFEIGQKMDHDWFHQPTRDNYSTIDELANKLVSHTTMLHKGQEQVIPSHSKHTFADMTDQNSLGCHYVPVGTNRGYFWARGEGKVYRYDSTIKENWRLINSEVEIDIPGDTIVYADIVKEITFHQGEEINRPAFHIIDGMRLGGKDIGDMDYRKRVITENDDELQKHLIPFNIKEQESPLYAIAGYLFMMTFDRNFKKDGTFKGWTRMEFDFVDTLMSRQFWKLDDGNNNTS
ncbi:unnamed protein product [Orchesella dallaii]|uniref:Cap-specific mRNA (nucleoside-2'-O-)-methyltransferase 1 n=1 Tax=Orchesella dallaii TaxID=48710 RepID=A0ABP1PV74_9HEXA